MVRGVQGTLRGANRDVMSIGLCRNPSHVAFKDPHRLGPFGFESSYENEATEEEKSVEIVENPSTTLTFKHENSTASENHRRKFHLFR
jgi:hypothetical protein